MLVMYRYCVLGTLALIYMKTKTGPPPGIHKSHDEITGEAKVVNEPIVRGVQA